MQVTLTIDGGFATIPRLARPLVADARALSAADADLLRRLATAAMAAEANSATTPASAFPDARRYRMTIEMDGACRTITACDPLTHAAVAALVEFVQARGVR